MTPADGEGSRSPGGTTRERETPAVVALIGNPNTGKTTLFNQLTGLRHKVANYPGCTVEKKVGSIRLEATRVELLDLPGTYSLAARSPDELIAVDVLLAQQAGVAPLDAVVAIVDASNLERNLYLLSQLLELELPLVVALNMTDVAESRGLAIDAEALAHALGAPVVPMRADRGEGLDTLREALARALASPRRHPPRPEIGMPEGVAAEIETLQASLSKGEMSIGRPVSRLEAGRLLIDRGGAIEERLAERGGTPFQSELTAARERAWAEKSPAAIEAGARYGWARLVVDRAVATSRTVGRSASDRIDAILTHPVAGSIGLLLVLTVVFQAIYRGSAPLMDLISAAFDGTGRAVGGFLPEGPLASLIVDGVIAGAGGVVVFLPQILVLFLFIAVLEDCGYMARAAFLMDRVFARLGLTGRSMIPLLSSFACAIPGIMSARAIADGRQRLATVLVAPLMSCSARLPVYVLLVGAFVPERTFLGGAVGTRGLVLLGAHLVGVVVSIPVLWIVRKLFFDGPTPPFVLELPPYRVPNWRAVAGRLYDKGRAFLLRAGTIILAASILVWAASYFPHPESVSDRFDAMRAETSDPEKLARIDRDEAGAYLAQSYIGRTGHLLEPAVEPLGWDWRLAVAVVSSFPAREVVIASLGTIFNLGGDVDETSPELATTLQRATRPDGSALFDLPVALSLIVFFALCCQCASTLAVMKRETGSWRWPAVTFVYMTVLAYVAALVTYRLGLALSG